MISPWTLKGCKVRRSSARHRNNLVRGVDRARLLVVNLKFRGSSIRIQSSGGAWTFGAGNLQLGTVMHLGGRSLPGNLALGYWQTPRMLTRVIDSLCFAVGCCVTS
ncbi:hypothetical protein VTK56DRAFT_5326 [Thermocarpiscus australiensis]